MLGCKELDGKRATVEFTVSESIAAPGTFVGIQVLDIHGNVTLKWYENEVEPLPRLDVNEDGVMNILDLVFVASQFGQTGTSNHGDTNEDGIVNVQDLVLVANGIGDASVSTR